MMKQSNRVPDLSLWKGQVKLRGKGQFHLKKQPTHGKKEIAETRPPISKIGQQKRNYTSRKEKQIANYSVQHTSAVMQYAIVDTGTCAYEGSKLLILM